MRAALRSSIIALSLALAGSAFAAHGSAPATPAPHAGGSSGPVTIVAPQYRVTPSYAKRVIRGVAGDVTNQRSAGKWNVTFLSPGPHAPIGSGATSSFRASWQWNTTGNHIALAVPDVEGSFNWQKAPGAPKGAARVTVTSPTP